MSRACCAIGRAHGSSVDVILTTRRAAVAGGVVAAGRRQRGPNVNADLEYAGPRSPVW
jgi:hypothetical protein